MAQITNKILMVRPANFQYNKETAENNAFQSNDKDESKREVKNKAIEEFDSMVKSLQDVGVEVFVIQDTESPIKPDAVFPNNWISLHDGNILITYPMFAENRRIERDENIISKLNEHFHIDRRYSFEQYEDDNMFLEGTGSMIFDRENKVVYACVSERTDARLIDKFCVLMGYQREIFHAVDRTGQPIYHTNVMMGLASDFAILCEESIKSVEELSELKSRLSKTGKSVINISYDQLESFAGNMLQVASMNGQKYLVMSQNAYNSLSEEQINEIQKFTELLPINIDTIEYYGGGSVRCMMAEIFLDKK